MMSPEAIHHFSREAAKKAARASKQPYVAWPDETLDHITKGGGIPNFGDYRPKGWKLIAEHFVDKSGFGGEHEPAKTLDRFVKELVVGHGYAMIEEGQFQCYVGEFERLEQAADKKKMKPARS